MESTICHGDANVAADLLCSAARVGSSPALIWGDGCWDYDRLRREALCAAEWCRAAEVGPDDRVALLIGSWPEHVAGWYGALLAGGVVVDVNPLLGDEEWAAILRDASPKVVICEPAHERRVQAALDGVGAVRVLRERGDGFATGALTMASAADPVPRSATDRAVIAYTSGTTGLPKGAVHTHGAIRRQLDLLASLHSLAHGDAVFQAVPMFPLHGFLPQVASAIRGGASVLLADKFSPAEFAAVSRRHPITYMTMSSPMLQRVLDLPAADRPVLDSLRVVTVGGAPLQPEIRQRYEDALGVHVTQGYGMTEMIGVFVADYGGAPFGSCGTQHPAGSQVVTVLGEDGEPVETGVLGEIGVHRSCALLEYWNDAQGTVDAFVGDWYLTGDIGRVDEKGHFFVVDRKKDVIIRGGFNIYSAEIERVLHERAEVGEAVVVGRPDDSLGEVPVAFVVPVSPIDVDELIAYVLDRLGPLKRVEDLHLATYHELPRNSMGKVLKRELRGRLLAAHSPKRSQGR